MKLPNGYGSVYKLTGRPLRRPWVVKISEQDPERGRVRRVLGYFATQREARDVLEAFHHAPPVPVSRAKITLSDLYEEWSAAHYPTVSKSMENGYRASWIRLSDLKDMPIKDIRTVHIQTVIDKHSDLSNSSLSKDKALIGMLLKYACQNDIILKNYAEYVKLPHSESKKKEIFSDSDLQKLKSAVGVVPGADLILIMCYTGFRIGEFLTLTQENIVDGAFVGGAKTDAGRDRIVPIHSEIKPFIIEWLSKSGKTIVCRDSGLPWSIGGFREKVYYPALEKLGIKKLSPHSTRHTFATLLSRAGVRTEEIQKLIGHSDYALTANIYTHPDKRELIAAIERI